MPMKPWYKIVTPREDLRSGKPLDASEFAVHLDHVRDGRAPAVYQDPTEFFERTYLTKNLKDLAVQVTRRLNGIKVETSAVFNLSTQFGGGKTHSLTLLYHLARGGAASTTWKGVQSILSDAGVTAIPPSATAIFVGTEFDSLTGRGGTDGTPLRRTPWGEIAFQLGGDAGFQTVAKHETELQAPGGDVIEKMLPKDKPALILLDELMNYVSRNRKTGLGGQLYSFLQNLSEVVRGRDNVVLAVSIPASELEMSAEDQSDFERFKKLLDRLGKAMIMSAEAETSEIIRRRLFEWTGLPPDAHKTIEEYEAWFKDHKQQLPNWFAVENARELMKASYPFHPSLLSVFERKWQGLPRFQQTRGVLRLLALWVSRAYSEGYRGAHKDPLISIGTAPLEDPLFRAAVFEQLGEPRLEPAVTTDIIGKDHAHSLRLDTEATAEVKKARLHRKAATTILFESNGGQKAGEATVPEIRFGVAEPGLDIGNVEQCLEALSDACYFLSAERNRYRFSFQPNLNKLLADRRASVGASAVDERVRAEVQKVFAAGTGVERVYFPQRSNQIPDRPVLCFVILPPEMPVAEAATKTAILKMTRESGTTARTFTTGLIWIAAEDSATLNEEARRVLAWKDIEADSENLKLDEPQGRQLAENLKRAERDLREAVWRAYKNVFLLAEDGELQKVDLGLVHSSASGSLVELILGRLKQEAIVTDGVSPAFLSRNWPPALPEWSTKALRDTFYSSPRFPRLLRGDSVKETISRGLDGGTIAYVGLTADGDYKPFIYKRSLPVTDIEVADEVFLILSDRAEEYIAKKKNPPLPPPVDPPVDDDGEGGKGTGNGPFVPGGNDVIDDGDDDDTGEKPPTPQKEKKTVGIRWNGNIPAQKWMSFYTKLLARFATGGGLKLGISVEVMPTAGITATQIDEVKAALRELGLPEAVEEVKGDG